jgi:rare lipoprotein A (peptidoglycan hydrolase)
VRKVTVAKKPDPATPAVLNAHPVAKANSSSYGVASFYTEDEWTANGERFDTHATTAAPASKVMVSKASVATRYPTRQ